MNAFARLRDILAALMRELSDEAAYERHLARHGAEPSPEQWRHFVEQKFGNRDRCGRCC
jgi:hypothetical protein